MFLKVNALGVLSCLVLFAQDAPSPPTFDAASIKVIDRGKLRPVMGPRMVGGPGTSDPTRIIWNMQTLAALIATAWGVDGDQVVGPTWLRVGGDIFELTATMPPGTKLETFRLMLQNLLIERFKIQFHHETKVFPGYDLFVAKGGPKLKPAADPDAAEVFVYPGKLDPDGFPIVPPGRGYDAARHAGGVFMRFQGLSVPEFTRTTFTYWIRQAAGVATTRIEDKTGLQGRFDFTLKFNADAPADVTVGPAVRAQMEAAAASAPEGGGAAIDGIFKAVEKQLGLQLAKNAKGFPLDTIIIDRCEKRPVE